MSSACCCLPIPGMLKLMKSPSRVGKFGPEVVDRGGEVEVPESVDGGEVGGGRPIGVRHVGQVSFFYSDDGRNL